eukprot:740531-Pelagomonas_calceolata.AAC.6
MKVLIHELHVLFMKKHSQASNKRVPGDCSHFAPGEYWSEMLLAPATTEWVVALLQQVGSAVWAAFLHAGL